MNILLLKGFNNYFNRIVKKYSTLADYKDHSAEYLEFTNINFNPNDGVATTLIVGGPTQTELVNNTKKPLNWSENGTPDYCIIYEPNGSLSQIKSRWFVLESERTREGQYIIALKRDVLAEYFSEIMSAPCFVEKGYINDVNNPLLLNAEGMSFNQIKQEEKFIKDNSHCAWLVGYVKKDIAANDLTQVNPITYTSPDAASNIPAAGEYDWESCIQYFNTKNEPVNPTHKNCFYFYNSDISYRTWYNPDYFTLFQGNVRYKFTENYQFLYCSTDFPNEDWGKINSCAFDIPENHKVSDSEAATIAGNIFRTTRDDEDVRAKFETMLAAGKSSEFGADTVLVSEDIFKYNGTRIIKDNKVYQLEINPGQSETHTKYFTGQNNTALTWMTSVAAKVQNCNYNSDNTSKNKIQVDFRGKAYQVIAKEVILDETISFNFPVSASRNECLDATYDMFCMPIDPSALGITVDADPVVIKYTDTNQTTQVADLAAISEMQLVMASKLCTKLGANSGATSLVYDLQLLPYCPFANLGVYYENHIYGPTYNKWVIDANIFEASECTLIFNNETVPELRGIIFYPNRANFSTGIDFVIPNETVHYEHQTVIDPIFVYNNQSHDGLPVWRFANFPYKCTDGVWDLNINEATVPPILQTASYISLTVSSGLNTPVVMFTSSEMPLTPTPSQQVVVEGNLSVKAHWIVPDRPEDVKVKNECDFYRLASPNFTSLYDFKKSKLKDGLLSFNIDCSYKPFTPYIKLNPNYDNSYYAVRDFNDSMGLICSGDFSLPMLSDAWINYELENRNYQAIFNRSIRNLDVNQQIAKEQQQFQGIVNMITAPITGAVGGALTGSKAGPYGAIAGAAVGAIGGGALSAAGYVKDMEWLEKQQQEARSFAIDNYQYQLGNVQAQNPTITKSTPLTYNNKIWPVLEFYSCTDKEKEVLRSKLKYDGMTVMAIGSLNEYSYTDYADKTYIKGKLIRLDSLNDDFHIADAVYQEVNKGFFVPQED